MAKYYTGVGSRETPAVILDVMRDCGYWLARNGWTLRSGAARGADQAFELGWVDWYANQTPWPRKPQAELYLPWNGYEKHDEDGCFGANILVKNAHLLEMAEALASGVHPAWNRCSQGAKKMHARNAFQVFGKDLATPSKFLVAYAIEDKNGKPKGGTATAISLARESKIEVFNLYRPDDLAKIESKIREWEKAL